MSILTARLFPARSFFFGTKRGKLDMTLFPRFLAGLSLRATNQFKQTCGAAAEIEIGTGGEFSPLRQKTFGVHRVEDELPFNVFLARQDKGDRLIVSIDQQQKCIVANRFTFET